MTCSLILSCARWQHTCMETRGTLAPCHPALDSEGVWSPFDPCMLNICRQSRHDSGRLVVRIRSLGRA